MLVNGKVKIIFYIRNHAKILFLWKKIYIYIYIYIIYIIIIYTHDIILSTLVYNFLD